MPPEGIRFFDVRCVRGTATHVDIDNGVVESAGTSFSDAALVRVLGPHGWGVISVNHLDPSPGKEMDRVLAEGLALARITGDPVSLAEAPRGEHPVPAPGEDPRSLSLEEKAGVLAGIERAAKLPGIASTRAMYIERAEEILYTDSSGYENRYAITRSGFSVIAVARRNGLAQMGRESRHTIHGFNLRHQEPLGAKAGETAIALLDAGTAKGGRMRAVLDPELAGVFAHEGPSTAVLGVVAVFQPRPAAPLPPSLTRRTARALPVSAVSRPLLRRHLRSLHQCHSNPFTKLVVVRPTQSDTTTRKQHTIY